MTQQPSQIEVINRTPPPPQAVPSRHATAPSEVDPVRLVLKNLRGRIPIAILIGLTLAIAGAVTPWVVLHPKYTASGLIRVAPTGRVILYEVEDNQPLSHYDSFVNTQQQLLKSRRILGAALDDEQLARSTWLRGPAGIAALNEAVNVNRARGAEIINISLDHTDPALAALALNAVLRAYSEIQIEGELLQSREQERLLEDRMRSLNGQVVTQRNAARQAALPETPEALQRMLQARTDDLAALRSTLTQVRLQPGDPAAAGLDPGQLPPVPVAQITDTQLRAILVVQDREFAALVDLLGDTQRRLLMLSGQVGPQHAQYRQASAQQETLTDAINDRIASYRDELQQAEIAAQQALQAQSPDPAQPVAPPLTLVQRLEQEERIVAEEIAAWAAKLTAVQSFLDEEARLQVEVNEVRGRLERLRFERQDQDFGRITIEEFAAAPTTPSTDRRVPLSAAAGLAGLGGGIALVVLFGMMRPAIRYTEDASDLKTTAPLLAAIPDLAAGSDQDREAAAFSVHHLRHLIESTAAGAKKLTLAVTSPGPGDGKTQITLGLATSFASAGRRVVALDLDFIGRGLTRATQHTDCPGLAEHLAGGPSIEAVTITQNGTPFAILPAGQPTPECAATLNSTGLRTIIEQLRERFEVILVDTGPILGSLEASAVVCASDSVLVVVGRGQKPPLVRAALARITSLGGKPFGLVFNRASSLDVNASLGSVSLRSGAQPARRGNIAPASLYRAVSKTQTPPDSDRP